MGGSAVLFVNTKDRSPQETDLRTEHESLTVTKGEKRGMNMRLYQYNFREFWKMACTSIELADALGKYGKAASPVQQTVTLQNHAKRATLHISEHRDRRPQTYHGTVAPGGSLSINTVEGHVLQISKTQGGKAIKE